MNPSATQPAAAPPDDPVRAALDDVSVRDGLLNHALAILGRRLADRPAADRLDKAREALQETCARALQKRQEYNSAWPVGAWVHGIMVNVLFEAVRGLLRLPAQESADAAAWEQLAVDGASAADEVVANRLDADGCLATLGPECREVLRLRFYEGLTHDEMAARLGISPGNARVRLCRAVNAARAQAAGAPREGRP